MAVFKRESEKSAIGAPNADGQRRYQSRRRLTPAATAVRASAVYVFDRG
jgi:hypothetical protein